MVTLRKTQSQIPEGLTSDILNDHYASISCDNNYAKPHLLSVSASDSYTPISEFKIFTLLDTLKPTATGPDEIPAWFLKLSAPFFCKPLTQLINLSLSKSFVPIQWKTSSILPLAKIPKPLVASDFRPISITPILSRLTERIVLSTYVYPAVLSNTSNLFFEDQFAFRPTGSTTNALISIYHIITSLFEKCNFVRVITLDFSKAFDTVRHMSMFQKYEDLNLSHYIHNWLVDFYTGRQHCTKFNDSISSYKSITASVIQGSALGPSSFSITASDLRPVHPHNNLIKFADDTYLIIPSFNLDSTEIELKNIETWSARNNLLLNRTKSHEIIFYPPRSKFSPNLHSPPCIKDISRVDSLKCLGVTLQANLSFDIHIRETINACATNLYAIKILRSKGLDDTLINRIFKATVLSKLLYASQFWWGFASASDREKIEAFLYKSQKCHFYCNELTFSDLVNEADNRLFSAVISNSQHTLHSLLPQIKDTKHDLRPRPHNFCLPRKTSSLFEKNFIIRMLYLNSY